MPMGRPLMLLEQPQMLMGHLEMLMGQPEIPLERPGMLMGRLEDRSQ